MKKKKWITAIFATVAVCAVALFAGCSVTDWVEQQFCDHTFNSGVVTRVSTCTREGELTKTCTECGYEEKVAIGKALHKEETVEAVSPTCTQSGKTSYVKCSVCEEVIVPASVLPATGHNIVAVAGTPATCLTSGLTTGSSCSVCGFVQVKQEIIPATGHNVVTVEGYAPTCVETGLSNGQKCTTCNTVFVEQTVLPVTGLHTYETVAAQAPTCTDIGWEEYQKCTVCGTKNGYVEIPENDIHSYKIIDGVASTCTSQGFNTFETCTVCGYDNGFSLLPLDNHTINCDDSSVCVICGTSLEGNIPVVNSLALDITYRIYPAANYTGQGVYGCQPELCLNVYTEDGTNKKLYVAYGGTSFDGINATEFCFPVVKGNGYVDVTVKSGTYTVDDITFVVDGRCTVSSAANAELDSVGRVELLLDCYVLHDLDSNNTCIDCGYRPMYTATFTVDGETVTTFEIYYGNTPSVIPVTPVKEGYTFEGWYLKGTDIRYYVEEYGSYFYKEDCIFEARFEKVEFAEVAVETGELVAGNWYRIYRPASGYMGSNLYLSTDTNDGCLSAYVVGNSCQNSTYFKSGPMCYIDGMQTVITDTYIDFYLEVGTYNILNTSDNSSTDMTLTIDETTTITSFTAGQVFRLEGVEEVETLSLRNSYSALEMSFPLETNEVDEGFWTENY